MDSSGAQLSAAQNGAPVVWPALKPGPAQVLNWAALRGGQPAGGGRLGAAELDGAAKTNINAIREELARRRDESRRARALLQLDAKMRFDAQQKQPESPAARFVAGSRRGRRSGGRKSFEGKPVTEELTAEAQAERHAQKLRRQTRMAVGKPKGKEQQQEGRPAFGVMSASSANTARSNAAFVPVD